jgi:PAS domain S-box-containing protein
MADSSDERADEVEALRRELAEAREALDAIRTGQADALLGSTAEGGHLFTLEGSDFAYRALVEQMEEGAATLNGRGLILFANQSLARLLGRPLEAVIGRSFVELVDDAHRASFREALNACAELGTPSRAELALVSEHGAPVPVSLSLRAFDVYGTQTLSVTVVDLTTHGAVARAEATQDADERYRLAIRATHDAIWDLDLATGEVRTNEAHDAMVGVRPAGVSGLQWWTDHVHSEDRDRVLASFKTALDGSDDEWRCEYRITRADGSPAVVFDRAYLVRDGSGRAIRVIGAMLDRTERQKAEEATRLSEQKFLRAFANNPAAISLTRLDDGLFVEVNGTWEALNGYKREEVIGRSARALGLWPSEEDATRFVGTLKAEGAVRGWEQEFRRKSGETIVTQLSAQLIESSGEQLILSTFVDVTERKRADEARMESEHQLRLLAWSAGRLLSAPDPQAFIEELCREIMAHLGWDVFVNFMADEEAAVLHMNACAGIPEDAVRRMQSLDYGVAVCGCVARDRQRIIAEDIFHSDDPRTAMVKSFGVQAYCCHPILAQGRLLGTLSFGSRTRPRFTEREVEMMRAVADQVAAAMQRVLSEKALRGFSNTLEQRVAERTSEVQALVVRLRELALDLTEAELRERRRIARILHDHFQQILVAAKLQVGVLLARVRAESLKASARQTDELLTEAIQVARTLAVELSPPILHDAGLAAGLEWLRQRMLQQHNLQVDITADAEIDPGTEDVRAFVYESVRELLFNVVKHAGVREARLSVRRRDGEIQVTVEDGGVGLAPGPVPNPFRNQVPTGTGLFSIGQRLELLGGSLSFEKAGGQGTCVKLCIPIQDVLAMEPATPVTLRPPGAVRSGRSRKKIRILLADDHRIVRQGFAALIRSDEDVEVVGEAADGAEVIELARLLLPDVVVMDVSMPKMNGIDATRWLMANLPRVRVIGLSMQEDEPVALAMREAGAVAFVTKDGPSAALMAAIHAARPGRLRFSE